MRNRSLILCLATASTFMFIQACSNPQPQEAANEVKIEPKKDTVGQVSPTAGLPYPMSDKEWAYYEEASAAGWKEKASYDKLPHYSSPLALLIGQADYTGMESCIKAVDADPNHIQICFEFLLHDNKAYIPEQRRSSIIHVAMQVFAMTDVDEFKLTCAPMGMKDGFHPKGIMEEFRKTVTVTRKKADKVMQKYLKTKDYTTLFTYREPYWTTTEHFDKLMLKEDSLVYIDLVDEVE